MSKTKEMDAKERLAEVLSEEALGERALRTILQREGYPDGEVKAAVREVDWTEQAQRAAQEKEALSPMVGYILLKARGFTSEEASQATYGTSDPIQSTRPDMPALADRLWRDLGQDSPESPEDAVRKVFGDTEISRDPQEVEAALAGDEKARCRIMASSLLQSGISRHRLQETLTEAGFQTRLVREQIRDLNPNWKTQCCLAAERIALDAYDRDEIQQALREEGFTPVQVAYALNTAHLSDDTAARAVAENYITEIGISAEDLHAEMEDHEFLPEQIALAEESVDAEGRDWNETGAAVLRRLLEAPDYIVHGRDTFVNDQIEDGYTPEQVETAIRDMDWARRAKMDYIHACRTGVLDGRMASRRRVQKDIEDLGYSEDIAEKAVEDYFSERDEMEEAVLGARLSASFFGSPEALRRALEEGLFTPEQVQYVMDRVFLDPMEGAAAFWQREMSQLLMDRIIPSPQDMRSLLEDEGFDKDVVEQTVANVGEHWRELAHLYVINLRANEVPENEIRTEMAEEKFHLDDIESTIVRTRGVPVEEAQDFIRAAALMMQLQQTQQVLEAVQLMPDGERSQEIMLESVEHMQRILDVLDDMGISVDPDDFAGD